MFLVVWMVLLFRPLMLDFCIVIGDEALTGGGGGEERAALLLCLCSLVSNLILGENLILYFRRWSVVVSTFYRIKTILPLKNSNVFVLKF